MYSVGIIISTYPVNQPLSVCRPTPYGAFVIDTCMYNYRYMYV